LLQEEFYPPIPFPTFEQSGDKPPPATHLKIFTKPCQV
jgi:hypothetical protein